MIDEIRYFNQRPIGDFATDSQKSQFLQLSFGDMCDFFARLNDEICDCLLRVIYVIRNFYQQPIDKLRDFLTQLFD